MPKRIPSDLFVSSHVQFRQGIIKLGGSFDHKNDIPLAAYILSQCNINPHFDKSFYGKQLATLKEQQSTSDHYTLLYTTGPYTDSKSQKINYQSIFGPVCSAADKIGMPIDRDSVKFALNCI